MTLLIHKITRQEVEVDAENFLAAVADPADWVEKAKEAEQEVAAVVTTPVDVLDATAKQLASFVDGALPPDAPASADSSAPAAPPESPLAAALHAAEHALETVVHTIEGGL